MNRIKTVVAILGTFIALLVGAIGIAPAANATHGAGICDGHWISATWGRGCVQPPYGQTQDILTDGYCVEAKWYNVSNNTWNHITNSTSCGAIASWQTNDHLCIRVYNGNGRYFTIRKQASYCP